MSFTGVITDVSYAERDPYPLERQQHPERTRVQEWTITCDHNTETKRARTKNSQHAGKAYAFMECGAVVRVLRGGKEGIVGGVEFISIPVGAAVTAQAPPPEIEDAFKAGFDAHIRGHRGAKGCASAFAEYVKPNQVPTAAQAPAPTDLERYDAATIVHAKEREQEYRRTIWAAAAALWPNPLRVPQITRDAYTRSSELQTRTDPATGDLLLFAARPSLPVQE